MFVKPKPCGWPWNLRQSLATLDHVCSASSCLGGWTGEHTSLGVVSGRDSFTGILSSGSPLELVCIFTNWNLREWNLVRGTQFILFQCRAQGFFSAVPIFNNAFPAPTLAATLNLCTLFSLPNYSFLGFFFTCFYHRCKQEQRTIIILPQLKCYFVLKFPLMSKLVHYIWLQPTLSS